MFIISIVTVNTSIKDFHKFCHYMRRKELGEAFSDTNPKRQRGRGAIASGFQPRRGGDTIARAAGPGYCGRLSGKPRRGAVIPSEVTRLYYSAPAELETALDLTQAFGLGFRTVGPSGLQNGRGPGLKLVTASR